VIAAASALVEPGGVLRRVTSAPPLTIRQVLAEDGEVCALCLVGSAAGPLPGDELQLHIDVADGARATLVASGAMIAQGRGDPAASVRVRVTVGADAFLDADPGALIACAGAAVDLELSIELAATASLRWRETLVLGRSGEAAGAARLRWDVVRADRPLLRQSIDLSRPALRDWSGMLGGGRVLLSELQAGPAVEAATTVHSAPRSARPGELAVTQQLAEHATLMTVIAVDSAAAARLAPAWYPRMVQHTVNES
jgi:urease accessory protein